MQLHIQNHQKFRGARNLQTQYNLSASLGPQLKSSTSHRVKSRPAVRKSATDTSWINLTFWDELAQVASQYVEKGHEIYVSDRLVSDVVESDDGKQQIYYKVVVQQLNFVERSFSSVALYDRDSNFTAAGKRYGNNTGNNTGSTEELWQAFFANPVDWWDNRKNKISSTRILEKLCGWKAGTIHTGLSPSWL